MVQYSQRTKQLYFPELMHAYISVPEDLVEITEEELQLMGDRPFAAVVYQDRDGALHYSESPPTTEHSFNYKTLQWEIDHAKVEAARKAAIPPVVSRAQGKSALIMAGYWQAVLDYVAAIEDPTERALAEVALHDTQEWRRDSQFLATACAAIGIDDAGADGLFIAASKVTL